MRAGKVPMHQSSREYLDVLVTLELAAVEARLDGRRVSAAIRDCCTLCMARVRCRENYGVLRNLRAVGFPRTPESALCMMRNQINSYMKVVPDGTS